MLLRLRALLRGRGSRKQRLLFRLLALSVRHARTLAILLYTCGSLGLLAAPLAAQSALSLEQALLAGQAPLTVR